jgi:hypothetical protein
MKPQKTQLEELLLLHIPSEEWFRQPAKLNHHLQCRRPPIAVLIAEAGIIVNFNATLGPFVNCRGGVIVPALHGFGAEDGVHMYKAADGDMSFSPSFLTQLITLPRSVISDICPILSPPKRVPRTNT